MPGMKCFFLAALMMAMAAWAGPGALHAQTMSEEEQAENAKDLKQQRLEYALENLSNPDETLVEQSVFMLEIMGGDAVPHLVREMTDRSNARKTRLNAVYALGRIGPRAARATPSLLPFLRHEEWDFRGEAVYALGKIGPGAAEAVPALIPRLRDPSRWVREGADRALMQIGTPEAKEAVAAYRKELQANKNNFSKENVYRR